MAQGQFVRRLRVENERVKFMAPGVVEIDDLPPSGVEAGTFTNATITVNEQGLVTDAANGAGGAGANELSLTFGWNNASPRTIGIVPAGFTVARVRLSVTTAFLDIGSAVTVGTTASPAAFMTSGQNDPLVVGDYESTPLAPAVADTTVRLTLSPGGSESSGRGIVVVEYEPTSGG